MKIVKKRIPKKYVPDKLSGKDKKTQKKEILKSRNEYKKGKYYTRRNVKSYKNKISNHILNARSLYGIKEIKPSAELSKATGCSLKALKLIEKKGKGAYYSSGSRPNQTAHSWGRARLASAISGGKSAAIDYNILLNGCKYNSKALTLAKKARKKHGYGTRKVPKILV
jgi:hypothetical protein